MSEEAVLPAEQAKGASTMENPKMDAGTKSFYPSTTATAGVEQPIANVGASATCEPGTAKPTEEATEKPYLTDIPALGPFLDRIPKLIANVGYGEMWGVQLKDSDDIPTINVLIKFLRANEGNVDAATGQLRKALEWRRDSKPLDLVACGRYSASKYGGLSYLTTYEQDGHPLVFTWNIYGAVKDVNATFGNSDEFVEWRVALMEMAVQELKMKDATTVIDYAGEKDPYRMVQVHDYLNVSFFRMDPKVRTATGKTIQVLSIAYPELLREKYFVNTPAFMGWVFAALKHILSRHTMRKFHPIPNGAHLALEFSLSVSQQIPKTYGGNGAELKDGARTVALVDDDEVSAGRATEGSEAVTASD